MVSEAMNTSIDQFVQLDIPGEQYFLTFFQEKDIDEMQEILDMPWVSDNLLRVPKPYTRADAEFWITSRRANYDALLHHPTVEERMRFFFSQDHAIPLQAIRHGSPTGTYVGCVGLTPHFDTPVVELGYYLHPAHHGKRIVPAAAKAALRWAKEEFGVTSVYGSADCCNPRSEGVMDRVSRETAVGEVRKGTKVLSWPVEKKVEGREVDSLSKTWEWTV